METQHVSQVDDADDDAAFDKSQQTFLVLKKGLFKGNT